MTFTPKTDVALVQEAKEILDAYVEKTNELLSSRQIVIMFSLGNGNDGAPAIINNFSAIKKLDLPKEVTQDNTPALTLVS